MKRLILPIAVLVAMFATNANAQSSKIYAITGETQGNVNWNSVREINSTDGAVKTTLYSPASKQTISYQSFKNRNVSPTAEPAVSAIAAAAYDTKNNRLYYTNMRGNTLNYVDLNEDNLTVVSNDDAIFNTGDKFKSEASIITRMTFGADGAGYALTNDGEHLVKFTTESNATISDLGRLIDGANNGTNSIHNTLTSWGGDMVGDAFGNLYVVTMHSAVYKVNTQTLVADYVGSIKGLPTEFTTNGAAVNEDGDLVVSSAIYTASYYKVDISTLHVIGAVKTASGVYNASDLASSNLLYQSKIAAISSSSASDKVSVYPNPAVGKNFQLRVSGTSLNKYVMEVTDARGKVILQNSTTSNETLKVNLPKGTASGIYYIKVTNEAKKAVYSDKLIVD